MNEEMEEGLDLSLATTEQLIKELDKRFKTTSIYLGIDTPQGDHTAVIWSLEGDRFAASRVLGEAKKRMDEQISALGLVPKTKKQVGHE